MVFLCFIVLPPHLAQVSKTIAMPESVCWLTVERFPRFRGIERISTGPSDPLIFVSGLKPRDDVVMELGSFFSREPQVAFPRRRFSDRLK